MKRKALGTLLTAIIFMNSIMPVKAQETPSEASEGLIKACATAYCLSGTMSNGKEVHEGACASNSGRLGCIIVMYQRLPDGSVGDYIGTYTVEDTGGSEAIKKGYLIDVWKPDMDACQEFMDAVYEDGCKGKVWIQVINGEG